MQKHRKSRNVEELFGGLNGTLNFIRRKINKCHGLIFKYCISPLNYIDTSHRLKFQTTYIVIPSLEIVDV